MAERKIGFGLNQKIEIEVGNTDPDGEIPLEITRHHSRGDLGSVVNRMIVYMPKDVAAKLISCLADSLARGCQDG